VAKNDKYSQSWEFGYTGSHIVNSTEAAHVVSEILEKVIDVQAHHAQTLTEVRALTASNRDKLIEIRGYFTNGMRTKIDAIDSKLDQVIPLLAQLVQAAEANEQAIEKAQEEITKKFEDTFGVIENVSWWLKRILLAITALSATAAAVITLLAKKAGS